MKNQINHNNRSRYMPIKPACGLHEDKLEMEEMENLIFKAPSFPLEVFPDEIRTIVEALNEYENYNIDFTAASLLTVFAAAMGNTWSARFMTSWVTHPIIFIVLVGSPSCGKTPPLQQAVRPLLKLDAEYDQVYCREMEAFRKWERMSAKQREKHSLPEEMTMPQRKCHVVVDSTVEALIGALRDNPRGVLLYRDEIDSLLGNFNRYNGSDESYFLSLFSGTPFKYSRKSNNEHIFLSKPYTSIIGTTQPGRLGEQFGGKRMLNGFSSRFLKVYPEITEMPAWSDNDMPEGVLESWEQLIRKVISHTLETDKKGKVISKELSFTSEAKNRINRWKVEVSNAAYSTTDSDAIRALCGKLETYIIRFSLIVQIMRAICDGASMESIDLDSAERAILLTEYFRSMESHISPELETGVLDPRYTELLSNLDDCFSSDEIVKAGLRLGISRSSVFRFLKDGGRGFITKGAHGRYCKIAIPK